MAFCRLCFVLMKPNALQMEYSLRKLFLHYALQLLIVNVPNTLSLAYNVSDGAIGVAIYADMD